MKFLSIFVALPLIFSVAPFHASSTTVSPAPAVVSVSADTLRNHRTAYSNIEDSIVTLQRDFTDLSKASVQKIVKERLVGYQVRSGGKLEVQRAYGKTNSNQTIVWVPLEGGGLHTGSSVAIIKQRSSITIQELAFNQISKNSGRVRSWVDGKANFDRVITVEDSKADGDADGRVNTQGLNWGKLNSCLAAAGIPAWLVAGLSALCAPACATIIACAPCIAAAGIGGFTVGWCVGEAWE